MPTMPVLLLYRVINLFWQSLLVACRRLVWGSIYSPTCRLNCPLLSAVCESSAVRYIRTHFTWCTRRIKLLLKVSYKCGQLFINTYRTKGFGTSFTPHCHKTLRCVYCTHWKQRWCRKLHDADCETELNFVNWRFFGVRDGEMYPPLLD